MKFEKGLLGLALLNLLACTGPTRSTLTPNSTQITPKKGSLSSSVAKGDMAQVRVFLEQGADVNELTLKGTSKVTPLLIAVVGQNVLLVKYLIDSGADIQFKYKGYQAEDLANFLQNDEMAKLLYYRRLKLENGESK